MPPPLFAELSDAVAGAAGGGGVALVLAFVVQMYDRRNKRKSEEVAEGERQQAFDAKTEAEQSDRSLAAAWKIIERLEKRVAELETRESTLNGLLMASEIRATAAEARIAHLESILEAAGIKYPPRYTPHGSGPHHPLSPGDRP